MMESEILTPSEVSCVLRFERDPAYSGFEGWELSAQAALQQLPPGAVEIAFSRTHTSSSMGRMPALTRTHTVTYASVPAAQVAEVLTGEIAKAASATSISVRLRPA